MQPHATTSFQDQFILLDSEIVMNTKHMTFSVPMLLIGAFGIVFGLITATVTWTVLSLFWFLLALFLLFQKRRILFNKGTRTLRTEEIWKMRKSHSEFFPEDKALVRIIYSYSRGVNSYDTWHSKSDYSHFEVFIYNNPARKYFLKEFTDARDARLFAKKIAGMLNVGYKSKIIIKGSGAEYDS